MIERGVKFAADLEAASFIPSEWRTIEAAVESKGLQVPGGVCKFEDARK